MGLLSGILVCVATYLFYEHRYKRESDIKKTLLYSVPIYLLAFVFSVIPSDSFNLSGNGKSASPEEVKQQEMEARKQAAIDEYEDSIRQEEARKEKIEDKCIEARAFIRVRMKDFYPTYEDLIDDKCFYREEDDTYKVIVKFKALNALGGTIVQTTAFYLEAIGDKGDFKLMDYEEY